MINELDALIDRYLKLCTWARSRYTKRDARGIAFLTTWEGGKPTVYTRICDAAFERYLTESIEAR